MIDSRCSPGNSNARSLSAMCTRPTLTAELAVQERIPSSHSRRSRGRSQYNVDECYAGRNRAEDWPMKRTACMTVWSVVLLSTTGILAIAQKPPREATDHPEAVLIVARG